MELKMSIGSIMKDKDIQPILRDIKKKYNLTSKDNKSMFENKSLMKEFLNILINQ